MQTATCRGQGDSYHPPTHPVRKQLGEKAAVWYQGKNQAQDKREEGEGKCKSGVLKQVI